MREHGLTSLNARGQMTDAVLERLSHLEQITCLNLGGSKRLTDDGLLHLGRMPQLVELDLSEYPGGRLTDRGLEVLRHLPALRRFQMCWQSGISDAGVANLAFCDRLERVDLLGSPTGDGAIDALRGKRHLRHFKTGRLVTDAGLPLLHDFPVFKTWQGGEPRYDLMSFGDADPNFLMLDGPFSDAGLAALAGLDGVFGLGFFWHVSGLTPDGLRPLADMPNLGALGCEGKLCNDTAMRHIAAIPRLRMLMAQGTVATDDGFAALSRSPTIEYIWGRECPNLQGRGFAALADMPALRGLAVSCKFVDDASLAALPRFPALTWLMPMDVPDEGFRHVGRCAQLEKLTCMYCRDTGDVATEHIAGLSRLKHYYAGKTQITDRSLEILGGMTSLEEVDVVGVRRHQRCRPRAPRPAAAAQERLRGRHGARHPRRDRRVSGQRPRGLLDVIGGTRLKLRSGDGAAELGGPCPRPLSRPRVTDSSTNDCDTGRTGRAGGERPVKDANCPKGNITVKFVAVPSPFAIPEVPGRRTGWKCRTPCNKEANPWGPCWSSITSQEMRGCSRRCSRPTATTSRRLVTAPKRCGSFEPSRPISS